MNLNQFHLVLETLTICDHLVISFDKQSHQMTYNSSFIYSTKFANYFIVYSGIARIPGAWGK